MGVAAVQKMIDLSEKLAIVTGGASGIGRGISLVLAEQGADVVLAAELPAIGHCFQGDRD